MTLRVKAASPDNDGDLRQLVELFRQTYGNRYHARQVYDINFWKRKIGHKIISLLGMREERVVAHLALRTNPKDPSSVYVLHPAIETGLGESGAQLTRQARELISRIAERQGWNKIYQLDAALKIPSKDYVTNLQDLEIFGHLSSESLLNSGKLEQSQPAHLLSLS